MNKKMAISLVLAAAIIVAPYTARAQALYNPNYYNQYYANYYNQYYAYYYYGNPIFWPVLAAGAILGTAALIATMPIRVVCANCLPPPAGFYPLYVSPPSVPSGPAMSYQLAR